MVQAAGEAAGRLCSRASVVTWAEFRTERGRGASVSVENALPAPERPGRDRGSIAEGLELGPDDARVWDGGAELVAEAAVHTRDHVFATDYAGVALDPAGHGLRVLDDAGGVVDNAGDQHFAGRKLDVLPHPPLVFVAAVGADDGEPYGSGLQVDGREVLQGLIVGPRRFAPTPADVDAHRFGRDVPCRVVQGLDPLRDDFAELLVGGLGKVRPLDGQVGAVELKQETRGHDRLVFALHHVRHGGEVFLLGGVVAVGMEVADVSRRTR